MMRPSYKIVEVNVNNVDEVGMYCNQSKRKEEGYQRKLTWIKERFREGLEYRVLLVDEGKKNYSYRGMIEFMPGTHCWRGINAPEYMVVHCIWVIGRHKNQGYGSQLLQESINAAKEKNMSGVAGMTIKKGGWLPKKELYLKNGFEKVDELADNYELYTFKLDDLQSQPKFYPISSDAPQKYTQGFTILSSYQCPYMTGTINAIRTLAEEIGEPVTIQEIKSYKEAQQSGLHPYGVFHVIYNGKYLTHLPGGMRDMKREIERLKTC